MKNEERKMKNEEWMIAQDFRSFHNRWKSHFSFFIFRSSFFIF